MRRAKLAIVAAIAFSCAPVAIAAPPGGGHFGGAGHFGGGGPHIGAGAHFAAPHVGGGGPHFGGAPRSAVPHFAAPHIAPHFGAARHFVASPHVVGRPHFRHFAFRGSHFPRYRFRRGRFHHFYHGWWYAFPWWTAGYSDYAYWSNVCASRWGYRTYRYYRCMRYHGFY